MKEENPLSQNSSSEPSIIQVFNDVSDPRSETSVNYRHPLTTILFITVAYKKKQDEQDRRRHDDQDDELFCIPTFSFGS